MSMPSCLTRHLSLGLTGRLVDDEPWIDECLALVRKVERERVINAIAASIDDTAGNHPWLHVGELLAMLETFK